jgi:hypothetical protein
MWLARGTWAVLGARDPVVKVPDTLRCGGGCHKGGEAGTDWTGWAQVRDSSYMFPTGPQEGRL